MSTPDLYFNYGMLPMSKTVFDVPIDFEPKVPAFPSIQRLTNQRATAMHFECVTITRYDTSASFAHNFGVKVHKITAAGSMIISQLNTTVISNDDGIGWQRKDISVGNKTVLVTDPATAFVDFMTLWEKARSKPAVEYHPKLGVTLSAFVSNEPLFFPINAKDIERTEKEAGYLASCGRSLWNVLAKRLEQDTVPAGMTLAFPYENVDWTATAPIPTNSLLHLLVQALNSIALVKDGEMPPSSRVWGKIPTAIEDYKRPVSTIVRA